MKKIGLLFFCFLFSSFVFAEDLEEEEIKFEITKVSYSGNFSEDVDISLTLSEAALCENLTLDNRIIPLDMETESSSITLPFSDLGQSSGILYLTCGEKKTNTSFGFPIINSVQVSPLEEGLFILINGENFDDSATVSLSGWSFTKDFSSSSQIQGKISKKIDDPDIYITSNSLQSSIYTLPIIIPKLTHIYTETDFKIGEFIFLCGENITPNTKIIFNNERVSSLGEKGMCQKIQIPYTEKTENSIYFLQDGIQTDTLTLPLSETIPEIISIKNSSKMINEVMTSVIEIFGKNFWNDTENIAVYAWEKKASIESVYDNKITIYASTDTVNAHVLYIKKGTEIESNHFLYKSWLKIPHISNLEFGPIKDGLRSVTVFLSTSNDDKEIYLDGSKITPDGCFLNSCQITLNENKLTGYFQWGIYGEKSSQKYDFNIEKSQRPVMSYMSIPIEITTGSRITIKGKNFLNSTITSTNLFKKDSDGKTDLLITNYSITGILSEDFNSKEKSSLTITKLGLKTETNFILDELEWNIIYGTPVIDNITSEDSTKIWISPGDIIHISGEWFSINGMIKIGDQITYPLIKSENSSSSLYVQIPETVSSGITNIQVSNRNNIFSSNFSTILLDKTDKNEVSFQTGILDDYQDSIQNSSEKEIYSLLATNKLQDLEINAIHFNFLDIPSRYQNTFGSFVLKVNWKETAPVYLDENNILSFYNISLPADMDTQEIYLVKKSPFIEALNFSIQLKEITLTKKSGEIFSSLNLDRVSPIYFEVFATEEAEKCIDSSTDRKYCNKQDARISTLETSVINQEQNSSSETKTNLATNFIEVFQKKIEKKYTSLSKRNDMYTATENIFITFLKKHLNISSSDKKIIQEIRRQLRALQK